MLHHSHSMSINMSDPTQIKSEVGWRGEIIPPTLHISWQRGGGAIVWNLLATAWNPRRFLTWIPPPMTCENHQKVTSWRFNSRNIKWGSQLYNSIFIAMFHTLGWEGWVMEYKICTTNVRGFRMHPNLPTKVDSMGWGGGRCAKHEHTHL